MTIPSGSSLIDPKVKHIFKPKGLSYNTAEPKGLSYNTVEPEGLRYNTAELEGLRYRTEYFFYQPLQQIEKR